MPPSIAYIRTTSRVLSSSTRASSYNAFRTNTIRQISSSSTTPSSNQSSFTDRTLVIGLLALTTLIGFGFRTKTKSQQFNVPQIEQSPTLKKSASTTETDQGEDTNKSNKIKNEGEEPSPTNESEQEGAFNPETGEINWDCPCLGGMAHGTCGEQFKAAFSCFVYSEQEPKGVECIEKFKLMQECFKDHPDEYGSELVDNGDPTTEEEGDFSADSSKEGGTTLPGSSSIESEPSDEDRELIPNQSSSTSNQDNERTANPLSQLTPSNEIGSNSPDLILITRSPEIDSDGKSNLL